MASLVSVDRLRFHINRFRERLWVRPLATCLLSIGAVFVAKLADGTALAKHMPAIADDSVETLLAVMAASMLVIATFSVASMVSAYASAGSTATPRSFTLIVADDVSQNALSTFVGAFIFSVVAITAVKNGFFGDAGLFILFCMTVFVFGMVIVTFVRWVDSIARLGRLGSTIKKVEDATADAMKRRRDKANLGGMPAHESTACGKAIYASNIGYVQHIDMAALQSWAEELKAQVMVAALPGTFASPDKIMAYIAAQSGDSSELDCTRVVKAFQIGDERLFEDDPRFGLVVLSEIAGRALSPAVNDPGTAISIIGTLVRLISLWNEPLAKSNQKGPVYDRVAVPEISIRDMFDDAFTAIARDGAGVVEVSVRLQKALKSLASLGNDEIHDAAKYHGNLALTRSQKALDIEEDQTAVRDAAGDPKSLSKETIIIKEKLD
jgi:uncharacterized membrane protein